MPRTLQDTRLGSRSSRLRLSQRREPYWRSISEGIAIGYRKGAKGGTWIARHYSEGSKRRFKALGTTDDIVDADGEHIFSFAQAQEGARTWFEELAREDAGDVQSGPYTVKDALEDYRKAYERRGGKGGYRLKKTIEAHIVPALGDNVLAKLTRRKIESWREKLVEEKPRLRTKKGKKQRYRDVPNSKDQDVIRRRRSTANRVLTVLKAALNHARDNRRVAGSAAWEAVKPFREVDAAKVRYLTDTEAQRLVNASAVDLRAMVRAALLTGARYSELAAMRAGDFNSDSGTVHIPRAKSGKARHIFLTDEGRDFFTVSVRNKAADQLIFVRSNGSPWKHAEQFRPIRDACKAAKITPAVGFHILRHTYGSRLAMKGVPMGVIAAQLGHADTRMTERHYAHLAPSYVADTVRAAFGTMGITEPSNVVSITSGTQ